MDPINYNLQVKDPFQSAIQGYQLGSAMSAEQQQTAAKQQNQTAQLKMQQDLASLASKQNASAADYASMITKYPALADNLSKGWNMLDAGRQKNSITQASQVYAALSAGKPDIAAQLLDEHATAFRNSGQEEYAKNAEVMAKLIKINPEHAKNSVGLMLASTMGPKEFANTIGKLGSEQRAQAQAGAELTKKQAEAKSAAIAANFAESNAVADLSKKGWDIEKLQNDIDVSKQNVKIAAMNAQLAKETNDLKRQELQQKLDDAALKRDQALREKTSAVEAANFSIDNMLNTVDRALKTPADVVKSATGPISSRMPTLSTDTANFEELISTIDAQSFLAQIPNMTGKGALSDAEGKKLAASLQNLSLRQGDQQLLYNLREAQRLMLKARKNLADKYGVPESVPNTPEAAPGNNDIDALLQKYGVNTQPQYQPMDLNQSQMLYKAP